nr:uncharacterized protein LOC133623665 [Nerophis lumbriciformis]
MRTEVKMERRYGRRLRWRESVNGSKDREKVWMIVKMERRCGCVAAHAQSTSPSSAGALGGADDSALGHAPARAERSTPTQHAHAARPRSDKPAHLGLMRARCIKDQWTQGSGRELSFLMVYLPFVTWKVSCASHFPLDLPLDSDCFLRSSTSCSPLDSDASLSPRITCLPHGLPRISFNTLVTLTSVNYTHSLTPHTLVF